MKLFLYASMMVIGLILYPIGMALTKYELYYSAITFAGISLFMAGNIKLIWCLKTKKEEEDKSKI